MATLEHNLTDITRQILERSKDYSTPLKRFYRYIRDDTVKMFNILGRRGNTTPYRGVTWKWFAAQYTRKDGTQVPAYGIPGKVKGRMRTSGQRVNENDLILSDSGDLRKASLDTFRISPDRLVAGSSKRYAKYQNKARTFIFINDDDLDMLRGEIIDWLVGT